jgi:hypothetical protein
MALRYDDEPERARPDRRSPAEDIEARMRQAQADFAYTDDNGVGSDLGEPRGGDRDTDHHPS